MQPLPDVTRREKRPWLLFLLTLVLGMAVLFLALFLETQLETGKIFAQFGEHLGSAVIVAGIMGLTYEWFVHQSTMNSFRRLLDIQNEDIDRGVINIVAEIEKMRQSIQAVRAEDLFKLLYDIAANRERIPTLYSPPRDEQNEFVFSTNHEFFQLLIANPIERQSTVKILRSWLEPSSEVKFRFLASDLVGLLRLYEIGPELRARFEAKRASWPSVKDTDEKSCLLNYAWAASRCENPPYRYLTHLLLNTPYADVQEWILFVPRQMRDPELRDMIAAYLGTRGSELSDALLMCVIAAMKALHADGRDMSEMARTFRSLFDAKKLSQELDNAIGVAVDGTQHWWQKIF
jgi:hypothetical protein